MKWFNEKEFVCRCCGGLPPLSDARVCSRSAEANKLGSALAQSQTSPKENIEALVENVLDPLRERYGKPIVVNSGYRCPKHNKEVGGATNSQHMKGEAADIRPTTNCPNYTNDLKRLRQLIIESRNFDQLIVYKKFLHVSWKRRGGNRRTVLWH